MTSTNSLNGFLPTWPYAAVGSYIGFFSWNFPMILAGRRSKSSFIRSAISESLICLDAYRLRYTYCVCELHQHLMRKSGSNHVLGDISGGIRCGTVYFGRVFA